MTTSNTTIYPRRIIRSFALRQGRMSDRQTSALQQYWPRYGLELEQGMLNMEHVFARHAPTVLEIGFGMGKSLLQMAKSAPEKNFIGIEVHRPGVGALLADMIEQDINNIRIFCADAHQVLGQCIPPQSLQTIQIFFPDPWPKQRHHKRRLIQLPFVELISTRLASGAVLQLATDWGNYATRMMRVISQISALSNPYGLGQFAPRLIDRPLTKYEQRGQMQGHPVWDLYFVKS